MASGVDNKKLRIPMEVYSRVVGYLRPISSWNPGKQAEWEDRKTYLPREPVLREKDEQPIQQQAPNH